MRKKAIATETAIIRVLTTPLGARVMRPHFGSELYKLVDRNYDEAFILDAIAYTYDAIEKNLPHLRIKKVDVKPRSLDLVCEDARGEMEVHVAFA